MPMSGEFSNIYLHTVAGRSFVHAPLADLTIEVDSEASSLISDVLGGAVGVGDPAGESWRQFLREADSIAAVVDEQRNFVIESNGAIDFRPTGATLSLTTGCNLRCVYCYIHGGDDNRSMPIEVARAKIDFIVSNALLNNDDVITLDFHGEGEPTFNWPLFKAVVEYAADTSARNGLKLELSLQTNGLWNASQRSFICERFDSISISLDGIEEVQHQQRPTVNGKGSFQTISDNLIAMTKMGISFGVRATVMPASLDKMEAMLEFLLEHTNVREVGFEPIKPTGRGHDLAIDSGFNTAFARRIVEVMAFGKQRGIDVSYSGCSRSASGSYCGATGNNINVTVMADGTISSCYEVPSEKHSLGGFFVYGRYNFEERCFQFDQDKLKRLINYSAKANSPCSSCFAQWSCKGDCLTKYTLDTLLNGGSSSRCSINKTVAIGTMVMEADRRSGVGSGEMEANDER